MPGNQKTYYCRWCTFQSSDENAGCLNHTEDILLSKKDKQLFSSENSNSVFTYDIEHGELLANITKKMKQKEEELSDVVEQYIYKDTGILLEKKVTSKNKEQFTTTLFYEPILYGDLKIEACVKFIEYENKKEKWQIIFNGNKHIGDFDEIIDYLYSFGTTISKKDELKRAIAGIIIKMNPPTKLVYPAVGLYMNKETKKPILALGNETVYPVTDSQQSFLRKYELAKNRMKEEEYKKVLGATVDFIKSMPEINKNNALFVRGYCCIAPLSYIFKESFIGIFPYIYLYGAPGSSKTHIADTSATYVFGEAAHLESDSVQSSFRLGMEFTSAVVPRVIDEAHDVFVKNLSIFKSGATSTTATQRGNKDKTMDKYQALSTFIFTSNTIPINPEEDAQGGIMNRILLLHCSKAGDFDKELYQKCHPILINESFILGYRVFNKLFNILDEKGIDFIVDEIVSLSNIFQKLDKDTELRRSYCLAELAYGIKIYYLLLKEEGIDEPIKFYDDNQLCKVIHESLQTKNKIETKQNLLNFMDFILNSTKLDITELNNRGVYAAAGNEPSYDENTRRKFVSGDDFIITTSAFNKHKQLLALQKKAYNHLNELATDLKFIGWKGEPKSIKDCYNQVKWGIPISLSWFDTAIQEFTDGVQKKIEF